MPKAASKDKASSKVGIIISQFEGDLAHIFDLPAISKAAKANPQVGAFEIQSFPSSRKQVAEIAERLTRKGIKRFVVAGCSERLYGKVFRDTFAQFGVPRTMIEFADILTGRVCRKGAKADTSTAIELINLALAKVTTALEPEIISVDIKPLAVVIGGGIAGISAALGLATRGVKVKIIERGDRLGGRLNLLNRIFPTYSRASQFLEEQVKNLKEAGVDVLTGVEPIGLEGHVGNYTLELADGSSIDCGVIIVATGADLFVPKGMYGYGERQNVITQLELERKLLNNEKPGSNIVMIQCVGSRNDERPYCSRICCTASIKNTITIKEQFPKARLTVLSRGIAEYAGDLDRARDMGVEIIRYSPERPPLIRENMVEVFDEISEMETHIPFDLVVLAVPMVPSESNRKLAEILRIPLDPYGFMIEPHLRLRPEERAPRGIFVAGTVHWPATITESVVQGYGAASRAFELLRAGKITREAITARVVEELCRGCRRCYDACEHSAIEMVEDDIPVARVVKIHCTGCGVCVSVCPSGAMTLPEITPQSLKATVEVLRRN